MKKHLITACALLSLASAALGSNNDNNPVSAGATQSRNSSGIALDGAMGNPALLGLERLPRSGLSLVPTSIAMRSDKIAPPFSSKYVLINPFDLSLSPEYYFSAFFKESFGLSEGLTPEEVSAKLTEELRGGISIYVGARSSPFVFATRGFGFSVNARADIDAKIPDGLLLPIFSATDGLLAGNTLDFSGLRVNAVAASEIAIKLGSSATVPFMRDQFNLDKGAIGLGMKVVLGQSYFSAEMDKKSAFIYDSASNKYKVVDATLNVVNIGTGLDSGYRYNSSLLLAPPSGYGGGIDLGTVFHNKRHAFSVDVQDIGVIMWDGEKVNKATTGFKKQGNGADNGEDMEFDMSDLAQNFARLFSPDSLKPTNKTYITWLPTALNVGYTYNLDFSGNDFNVLLGYLTANMNYNQQIVLGPGKNTYMPRLSAGGSLGLLAGCLPIRYGLVVGGPEQLASAVGIGLDARYLSIDVSYKAVGSSMLISQKGFEYAAALTFKWGWNRNRNYVKDLPEEQPPVAQEAPAETPPEVPQLPVLQDFPANDEEEIYKPIEIYMTMLPPPPPPQLTVEETKVLNTSQRAINFKTGSAELTPESYAPLEAIASLLRQHPQIRYEVQGHTDSQGNDVYNLLLSAERASAVKYYLLSRGAPQECLIAIGYGKNMPIAYNNTAEGRAKNRRVEFVQILSQEQYDMLKVVETEMAKSLTERVLQGKMR